MNSNRVMSVHVFFPRGSFMFFENAISWSQRALKQELSGS